jgi:hypothetical protein
MADETATSAAASADEQQAALHAAWLASQPAGGLAGQLPQRKLPLAVAWLGYGGLMPFIAFTAAATQGDQHADLWRAALFSYAAVILSFVGALHWGFAMTATGLDARLRTALYVGSVLPALLAWPALLLYAKPAMVLLIAGFAFQYGQDWRLARKAGAGGFLPPWYLPLRLRLSLVACVCIAVAAFWHGR